MSSKQADRFLPAEDGAQRTWPRPFAGLRGIGISELPREVSAGLTLAALKLAAIMVFLLLTAPTASYALANAALQSGMRPEAEGGDETT